MSYRYFLAGWVDAWMASASTTPSAEFVMGPSDRPKRAAWSTFETDVAMGQITVWESGECDVEVYGKADGGDIWHDSMILADPDDLGSLLRRLVNVCVSGSPPPGT